MFISKSFSFEAAHILPRHPGKCSREHGHSWRVIVEVSGPIQKESQFVMDYATLKREVQPIIDRFDHQHLNGFVKYPSSENLAIHIAHELCGKLIGYGHEPNLRLVVKVSETQATWAVWDSSNPYDMDIFRKFSLDTPAKDGEPPNLDAEWRSPSMGFPSGGMVYLEQQCGEALERWIELNAMLQQRKLYNDSLKPVDIRKELGLDDEPVVPGEKDEKA